MRRMLEPTPYVEEAQAALVKHFGLTQFRTGQAEVVSSVLAGRNAVVVMPTGAGKSLCFQLPALLLPGLTLVVSPLIALMKDQVEQLTAKGIAATFINSSLGEFERAERLRGLRARAYKLVYAAPERLRSEPFLELLKTVGVSLLAVDEAHCISQWGHDFRPDYAQLARARRYLLPSRTIALTATATPEVRDDIVRSLRLKDPQVFVAGFDRPNLALEVVPVSGDEEKRGALSDRVRAGGGGIVYCATRKAAESIHHALRVFGPKVVLYHAGLDDSARRRAQDAFMSTRDAVAVATNAFGMGIDKQDLRFVLHANIPHAVEAYYQEIGRAGRNGAPAQAQLLFNHADVFTQERLIQANFPPDALLSDVWDAIERASEGYARGQHALAGEVGGSELEVSAALRILERAGCVERDARGEGAHRLVLHTGVDANRVTAPGPQRLLVLLLASFPFERPVSTELSTLALRLAQPEADVRQWLTALERQGFVSVTRPFGGRVLRALRKGRFADLALDLAPLREQQRRSLLLLRRMTDYAYAQRCRRAFLLRYFGEEPPDGPCGSCDLCRSPGERRAITSARTVPVPRPPVHSELAAVELRRFRRELSESLGLPAFTLFNDKTLFALATALPVDREDFLRVRGTGERHWERFGPRVVEISLLARAAGARPTPVPRTRARRA